VVVDWVVGVVVLVPVVEGGDWTGRVSHHFSVPTSGSPKVALLQGVPPVNVRGAVKVPFAP
jgi:hypothetical protein